MKKLFSAEYSNTSLSIGLFLLRLAAGGLLIPHGLMKLQNFNKTTLQFGDPFGIGPTATVSLSIFAELFCSILIVIGIGTRLACIPVIINMSVAAFVAHKGDIFDTGEKATLYLAMFITLLFTGPGRYSIDGAIAR